MKRYLLVGIAVLLVSANASLMEDFAQMEQEQDQLLKEMRKSAASSIDDEDVEEDTDILEDAVEPEKVVKKEKAVDATHNVNILTSDNSDGKITTKTIEAAFEKAGFFINDNRDMTAPWLRQCKAGTKNFSVVDFDVYNLFTTFKKDVVVKLGKKYPQIGLFSPMSMSIWTRKGSNTISVSSLSASAMAEIMEIPADDPDLIAYGKLVQDTLKAALPNGKVETVKYAMKKPIGDLVSRAQFDIDPNGDWEEIKDEFQADFEAALIPAQFINAGFNDINYEFEENEFEEYNFYDVYSICYLEVIYTVAKTHPEAGAFAPCSLYMYQKKGTDTMEIGFPSVYNWIASLAIEDKPSKDVLLMAQQKMDTILNTLTELKENDSEEKAEDIRKKAMEEVKEKDKSQKAKEEKAAALKAEIEAKEAEIKKVKEAQEKAAAEQREAEKREVEAYEKQRAEKLAKEAAQKAELEKKQLAQKALEEESAKQKSMETVVDVNITRELEEETKSADAEYENAVKEMQEED